MTTTTTFTPKEIVKRLEELGYGDYYAGVGSTKEIFENDWSEIDMFLKH